MGQNVRGKAHVEVALDAFPYLADHRLQGLVVLPGSAYVEMARAVAPQSTPGLVETLAFQRMCAFTGGQAQRFDIAVRRAHGGDREVQFVGRPHEPDTREDQRILYASLKIPSCHDGVASNPAPVSFEEVRARCDRAVGGAEFYEHLKESGNDFGAAYQGITALWRGTGEAAATLSLPRSRDTGRTSVSLHAPFLDVAAQLLAATLARPAGTFLLAGVDRVSTHGPPALSRWGHARVARPGPQESEVLAGDVILVDDAGAVLAELVGLRLRYFPLEPKRVTASKRSGGLIAISATFTAEPLRDSLEFWVQALDLPCEIAFAPFNQPVQQLLDPASLLNRNRHGLNVILVRLEDWLPGSSRPADVLREEQAHLLANRSRHVLPNGMTIADLNHYETEHLYDEIFVKRTYLQHGISLEPGDFVVDGGANIGLFTLFAQRHQRDIRVCAIEPAPAACDALRTNADLYGSGVDVVNCGLSDERTPAWLTVYPRSSLFTGFHADPAQDRAAIKAVVENVVRHSLAESGPPPAGLIDELIAGRLESDAVLIQRRTLSDIIRAHGITRIDLLKLDIEKSELAALRGIEEADWHLIQQIVVEVHDPQGTLTNPIRLLLEERGFDLVVGDEELLRGSGLRTIYARRPQRRARPTPPAAALEQSVDELAAALEAAGRQAPVPTLLVICPSSPAATRDEAQARLFASLEKRLAERTRHVVGSAQLRATYPGGHSTDPLGDALGRIPYTPAGFAAIGTMIARRARAVMRAPYKVVVLDCDDTLWKGVCGESGPQGIVVDPSRQAFQQFLVELHRAGMLLCLCSKNREADVLSVFQQRADMPLRLEHCVAWRINWASKSDNIRSLASELHVGLESVVFIDDDPVECAEVRSRCPQVLTVQLPAEADAIGRFPAHVWAFDYVGSTEEDRQRTLLHRRDARRERFRQASLTLGSFIAGLGLEIRIAAAQPGDLPRVAQLLQRTNQFALTTARRSEDEVRRLVRSGTVECLVVDVTDRFGHYGLVGAAAFTQIPDGLLVDTFVLSCRALGRGVEHRMLAHLGEVAVARGISRVQLLFVPGVRNEPARRFVASVGARQTRRLRADLAARLRAAGIDLPPEALVATFPARRLMRLRYDPDAPSHRPAAPVPGPRPAVPAISEDHPTEKAAILERIPSEMAEVGQILAAVNSVGRRPRPSGHGPLVPPATELERLIAEVWQRTLGIEQVGVDDNFFALGGSSLRAVQVNAELRRVIHADIPVVSLFDRPTIRAFARSVGAGGAEPVSGTGLSGRQRGKGRRMAAMRRWGGAQR